MDQTHLNMPHVKRGLFQVCGLLDQKKTPYNVIHIEEWLFFSLLAIKQA